MIATTSLRTTTPAARLLPLMAMLLLLALGLPGPAAAARKAQRSFSSPEKGVQGLIAAVRGDHIAALTAIFGPGSEGLISSGDPVADRNGRKSFVRLYEEKHRIERPSAEKAILVIGPQDHPFPIPLARSGTRWRFDRKAGREELLNRRIGRNELNAIAVARAFVTAQREYASRDRNGDGIVAFAGRFRSTPGTRDGLSWEVKEGEEESPFGPLVAQASREGYGSGSPERPEPYHGYFYRILTEQGEHAEGGAYDYLVNGRMILGFALIAYPAQYGSSGIMTFIVNQNGSVYQKDLGPATDAAALALTRYDPDPGWKKVEQ